MINNIPNKLKITQSYYINEGLKIDILKPSEIEVLEITDEYVILKSSMGFAEITNNTIDLNKKLETIKIKKGEKKQVTLPMLDYYNSISIEY